MERESVEKSSGSHAGLNVQRIRMFLGIKQETLAAGLGISGSEVSKIEKQDEIEEELLSRIAGLLGVSPEVIKGFDTEKAIYNINHNNFQDATISEGTIITQQINSNEKIIELYERLLQSEREKIELLKQK
ncbi:MULTISPECIES: helix-turn-helix domain-containing protein [Dysgonomonadaceae]|jgi:transcriptional regulator with XRE-family HTH domain|uniref:helix-turn-helix domain-containing protein n=1 Tax=Dysgonomonadaceae TaxID=2005520 RepID=UPI000E8E447D|nr:helix-turn-helix transcriptional regulator [Proteiniphilum sp. UBA5480]HBG41250.1 transcriptional regulator [Porphyromonadaceae bacterium]HBK30665.1 transcriptional regulator [Porphyromonadaceae bacterium]HBX18899.1 transcriptional regulator [Porphyromonadaceae bacterium]HBX46722.1 transcriptional regulator [Porphyromonadaceae bacterium]HCM21148.1 transcriptional regulator [Porphyromonadaceae bacterium]